MSKILDFLKTVPEIELEQVYIDFNKMEETGILKEDSDGRILFNKIAKYLNKDFEGSNFFINSIIIHLKIAQELLRRWEGI